MRFLGNIEAKLDAKNRVFVPASFRRVLTGQPEMSRPAAEVGAEAAPSETNEVLYVRKDVFQDCLVIYPMSVWENELGTLRARLNKWDPEQQDVYRQFMLEAEMLEMDVNGRILLPRRLLDKVGIGREVRFLGVDDTIELWPAKALETPRIPADDFKLKIQELMK